MVPTFNLMQFRSQYEFRPYQTVMFNCETWEAISFPWPFYDGARIMIRRPGDPLTMREVNCKDIRPWTGDPHNAAPCSFERSRQLFHRCAVALVHGPDGHYEPDWSGREGDPPKCDHHVKETWSMMQRLILAYGELDAKWAERNGLKPKPPLERGPDVFPMPDACIDCNIRPATDEFGERCPECRRAQDEGRAEDRYEGDGLFADNH